MKIVRIVVQVVLLLIVIYLSYAIYQSIMAPIRFQKKYEARKQIVIEKLKKIRDAEEAFRLKYHRYTGSFDTLINFIKYDSIPIVKAIGTVPDSIFIKAKLDRKKAEKMALEMGIIVRDTIWVAVKDTLFKNYDPDTLRYIPFSNPPEEFQIQAGYLKTLSNVTMPVFEVKAHNNSFLQGLDRQMVINLNDEARQNGEYPGLYVGSMTEVTTAGNWDK